jgi:pimeloyl-ACP methyl ester carboxylesterase/AraC-like DNA-binding protein
MDVLDQILGSLRLAGGIVTDAHFSGDFCIRAELTPDKCAPFFPMPETLVAYHYLRSGEAVVEVDGLPPATVRAGELVLLPRNEPHTISSGCCVDPCDVEDITVVTADGLHRISCGSGTDETAMWCGFLGTARNSAHPLLESLPPLLILDVAAGQEAWVDASMRFMSEQTASPETVARLAEMFLSQAIRDYLERLPPGSAGWLRGLADPAVSKALSIIHTRYAETLDVEMLAREAGVSRTVLGQRFVELLGEPPMRYCARWRMRMAANMFRAGKQNSANVGYSVGFNSEAAFNRAFKREYGEPPATWKRRIEEQERAAARPAASNGRTDDIGSCSSADGTKIAYASSGEGFPLLKAPTAVTHLEHDWSNPIYGHWISELSRSNRLIRADMRGFGMSQWDPPLFSMESHVSDLAAVIDASGIDQCDLIGLTHGGAIAIAYAARYPERVRKLVLLNSFASGWAVRGDPAEIALRKGLVELNFNRWRRENVIIGERFMSLYFPAEASEIVEWHKARLDQICTAEIVERMLEWGSRIDVRGDLAKVRAETLVLHAAHDGNAPIEVGRQVADAIAGARFLEVDSANHVTLSNEPAWPVVIREIRAFLAAAPVSAPAQLAPMPGAV